MLQTVEILAWYTHFSNDDNLTSPPDSRTLVSSSAGNEAILRLFVHINDLTAPRGPSGQMRRFVCSVAFDPNSQLLDAVGWWIRKLDSGLAMQLASNFQKA